MGEAPQYYQGPGGSEAGSDSEVEERSVHDSEGEVESAEESVDGGFQLPPLMTESEGDMEDDVPLLAASELDDEMLTSNANPFSSQVNPSAHIPASM
jgi:hypothetical protein